MVFHIPLMFLIPLLPNLVSVLLLLLPFLIGITKSHREGLWREVAICVVGNLYVFTQDSIILTTVIDHPKGFLKALQAGVVPPSERDGSFGCQGHPGTRGERDGIGGLDSALGREGSVLADETSLQDRIVEGVRQSYQAFLVIGYHGDWSHGRSSLPKVSRHRGSNAGLQ